MGLLRRFSVSILMLAALTLGCYPALAQESQLTFSVGAEYTTGTYGGTQDIEDVYVPFGLSYKQSQLLIRATVPFLSVKAPSGTQIGPGGEPIPGSGQIETNSGLGDILFSLTYMDLWASDDGNFALDVTGKIKAGTADETEGLGTGETDYSVQMDLYRFFDGFTLFGNLGYKFRGQPPGVSLDDVWFAAIGGSVRLNRQNRLGAAFDFRPSAYSGNDDIREISVNWSSQLREGLRLSTYVLAGFGDSSPDWGVGFRIRFGG